MAQERAECTSVANQVKKTKKAETKEQRTERLAKARAERLERQKAQDLKQVKDNLSCAGREIEELVQFVYGALAFCPVQDAHTISIDHVRSKHHKIKQHLLLASPHYRGYTRTL